MCKQKVRDSYKPMTLPFPGRLRRDVRYPPRLSDIVACALPLFVTFSFETEPPRLGAQSGPLQEEERSLRTSCREALRRGHRRQRAGACSG